MIIIKKKMKKILKKMFCFEKIIISKKISKRLDIFLKNTSDLNWGQIHQILKKKKITVKKNDNKKITSSYNYILKEQDEIKIPLEIFEKNFSEKKIIFEKEKDLKLITDEKYVNSLFKSFLLKKEKNYLILNKPNGLYSQGTNDIKKNLFIISKSFSKKNFLDSKLHLVHRLDLPVSGILLIALNKNFAQKISELIKNHKIQKNYISIVENIPFEFLRNEKIDVEAYMKFNKNTQRANVISHKSNNSVKMTKTGIFVKKIFCLKKDFSTKKIFFVKEENEFVIRKFYEENKYDFFFYSEIEYDLQSGKRHQLRALAKDVIKCPILLDKKYGWKNEEFSLEEIIHKKLISENFIFSKDEILQNFFKMVYENKDYIYLHSKSVILDNFEKLEDEEDDKIKYEAELPAHFKLFYQFFETN